MGTVTGRAVEANYTQTTSGTSVGLLGSMPRKRRLLLVLSDDAIQMLDLETDGGKVTQTMFCFRNTVSVKHLDSITGQ